MKNKTYKTQKYQSYSNDYEEGDEYRKDPQSSGNNGGGVCFFCAMKETNPWLQKTELSRFFSEMPYSDDPGNVLAMSTLWSAAMARPTDAEFTSAGALRCAALLLHRALSDPSWLSRHQNIYIPYYAAHVIGSYTLRSETLAEAVVEAGAVAPLVELLRGRISWIEQRVAVRALGHLASYHSTFNYVANYGNREVVHLAMATARGINTAAASERKQYQNNLITRGIGGKEMEDWRAEEWVSQLRCWSLYLLSCFATRNTSWVESICKETQFLTALGDMQLQGCLDSGSSPAAPVLMRILCRNTTGRVAIADQPEVVKNLCNLSCSSDDWQYIGIDCLLLLLKDHNVRAKLMNLAASSMMDFVELVHLGPRKNIGKTITETLLLAFDSFGSSTNETQQEVLRMVERKKKEKSMKKREAMKRSAAATKRKKEGNDKFWAGDIEGAAVKYHEALELCAMERREERLVLYSNKAQCRLLLGNPQAAAKDATRALCLSSPANAHAKSLWRRAQAYDALGMAKECLTDCLSFVKTWNCSFSSRRSQKMPYYVTRMIGRQMIVVSRSLGVPDSRSNGCLRPIPGKATLLPTIEEEPWRRTRWQRKGKEKVEEEENG